MYPDSVPTSGNKGKLQLCDLEGRKFTRENRENLKHAKLCCPCVRGVSQERMHQEWITLVDQVLATTIGDSCRVPNGKLLDKKQK